MYSLKGFINIPLFADNSVGAVAPLGELSTRSRTYSREIGEYHNPDYAGVKLISFSSLGDDGMVPVPEPFQDHVLAVASWVYNQALLKVFSANGNEFLSAVTQEFIESARDFECGAMIQNGEHWMPEYLRWSATGIEGESDNQIKIWFSDAAFQAQYDGYEIIIVPPVANIDDLFKSKAEVEALVKQRTMRGWTQEVELATNKQPYTFLRTHEFEWTNPDNSDETMDITWMVAIYGAAGDNVDFIKQRLHEYILEHSEYDRDEWVDLVPDIFRVTEFIVIPQWDQYAIPNQSLVQGIYSPIGKVRGLNAKARQYCPGYDANHVESVLTHMNFVYKSLGLLIVGGPENRDGKYRFDEVFSDYILVPTTHHDFNRMSVRTQNWILLMYEMLVTAESMTEYSDIPTGMSRLTRNGVTYLVANFEEVNYLVVAKRNVIGN